MLKRRNPSPGLARWGRVFWAALRQRVAILSTLLTVGLPYCKPQKQESASYASAIRARTHDQKGFGRGYR